MMCRKMTGLVYFTSIALLAVLPINGVNRLEDVFVVHLRGDYLIHSLIFLPFFIVAGIAGIRFSVTLYLGLFFATVFEAIQWILPYRSFNINDMVANVLGLIAGIALLALYAWVKRMRSGEKKLN